MKFNDVTVRIWENKDIEIIYPNEFNFLCWKTHEGLQCNFEENTENYNFLHFRLSKIAKSFEDIENIIKQ